MVVSFIITAVATLVAWLLLARVMSAFAGVGTVELLLLLLPALVGGVWTERRITEFLGRRN